uniref:RNA polymerase I, II and III 24.3 kDa subunit n=1 Tax=Lotharella vacuolata TaxID=74820 RepID=A0A0H5BKZ8_9EUKA|nr:RNA polymerase I, II and III 24.3 kDa subunit [Lotharella vacuolata]
MSFLLLINNEFISNYEIFKIKCMQEKKNYYKTLGVFISNDNLQNKVFEINHKLIGFFKNRGMLNAIYLKIKIEILKLKNAKMGIFIIKKISSSALKMLKLFKEYFMVELFYEYELVLNAVKHYLVPDHELLYFLEKKKLLDCYKIKESQLPKILINDPIARYYGARKGDIFKITRYSETVGVYVTYRVCK